VHGLPQDQEAPGLSGAPGGLLVLRNGVSGPLLFRRGRYSAPAAALLGVASSSTSFRTGPREWCQLPTYYTAERITALMSHWNTYSEEEDVHHC